jgi:hypothetical protein
MTMTVVDLIDQLNDFQDDQEVAVILATGHVELIQGVVTFEHNGERHPVLVLNDFPGNGADA